MLITDAGRGSALAIIRALGREGWHVVAADTSSLTAGMVSRYAADTVCYPAPNLDPRNFVDALVHAVQKFRLDLVIPVTDLTILPLSIARDRFQDLCSLALPHKTALEIVTDKLQTIQLAEQLGVPTPRTRLAETVEEAVDQCAELSWPVVLKPQKSRLCGAAGESEPFVVSFAQDQQSLIRQMASYEARSCPVLLQEYRGGVGYGVELLMHQGSPLAAFQHRRLREYPVYGGPSALRESVALQPELYEHAVRLLREIGWTGLAMVEFKVGESGTALMEINGRPWGSLPLAVHSGMNFPSKLAALWVSETRTRDAAVDTSYKVGVRGHNLELELKWIVSVLWGRHRFPFLEAPRRAEAWQAVAGLFHPRYRCDNLSWKDPQPALFEAVRVIRKSLTSLLDWKRGNQSAECASTVTNRAGHGTDSASRARSSRVEPVALTNGKP